MDNDDKIKTDRPEISLFLQDGLMPAKSDIFNAYNFEREFEKTRKNKNHLVLLLFALTCIAALGITAGITQYQSKKNTEIKITIDAFQDLNLQRLLASFQRVQENLENAIAEKEGYKKAFETAQEEAGFSRESALVIIDSMILAEQDRKERITSVQSEYSQTMKGLTENYNRQITEIDKKIAALQEEITSLQTPELAQAQAEVGSIDSRQQVFDLEKQRLVASYEQEIEEQNKRFKELQKQSFENQKQAVAAVSKQFQNQIALLDPVISDEKGDTLLATILDSTVSKPDFTSVPTQSLRPEDAEKIKTIRDNIETADYLAERLLEQLPQKNSVPLYVTALKNSVAQTGNSVTGFLSSTVQERETQQKELATIRSEQEKVVSAAQKQLETAQKQLETTKTQFETTKTQFAAANKSISELTAKNTELTKSAATAASSIKALTSQTTSLSKQLETANAKVGDLNTKLTSTQNLANETQKTLSDTQTKLKTAEVEAALKSQMENYLVYLIEKSGEIGFIVDVGDRKSLLIQVHPSQAARIENRTVYIFSHETGAMIGTVIIRKKGNNLYAYPSTDTVGQKVSVNDHISLTSTPPVKE